MQGDYFKNDFAGIDHRLSGAGGAAYSVVKTPAQDLKVQAGVGYAKESRIAGGDKSFTSGQAGLLYKIKLSATTGTEPASRANQAAAFAKISRSCRSRAFSGH